MHAGDSALCLSPMAVIATTMCYPSSGAPSQGVFIRRRLAAMHAMMPLHVVVPVPWFPLRTNEALMEPLDTAESPPAHRVRMPYIPRFFKQLDGEFYARALRRGLHELGAADGVRLIDAHFVWPDGVGAWRVARELGVPFVCTIRGKLVSQIREASKRRQIREMLLNADRLIAVSQSLADLADEVAERAMGAQVIPNGVDTGTFRPMDRTACRAAIADVLGRAAGQSELPNDARIVVSVGHLQELKGFHRMLEVWPEVRREVGDVRLVLVGGRAGEPAYERRLREMARAAGLDRGEVVFAGRQAQERVAMLLNAADLFALASRSEGWCNAIAESLACGCPVVATDVGGNREIVCEERLGRLVPLDDRTALTRALCEGLDAKWDRAAIAAAGGQRDWQQVGRECVDVFNGVMQT